MSSHSFEVKLPVFILRLETKLSQDSILLTNCSLDISNENMATPALPCLLNLAICKAKFIASALFPTDGLAAKIISSSGWKPAVA